MYYNLIQFIDVDFCIYTETPKRCIEHLFKNNNGDLVNKITIEKEIEADIVICSARLLYDEVCKLKCKRLIVLDSLDLAKSLYGVHPDIKYYVPEYINNIDVIFLSNSANIMSKCVYAQMVYYQKLSKERLNTLPIHRGRTIEDYSLHKKMFYDVFNYRRTDKPYAELRRGKYFENFGRSIFEHIYYGKSVNYYIDGMYMKDGLYHYLELFGINGMIPHMPLPITKEMVEDKLFMKKNDPILNILKGS